MYSMKILCVYVLSGNGHLVPARTVKIELEKLGHEVRLEQVLDIIDLKWLGKLNRIIWREMLRHSKIEEKIIGGADNSKAMTTLTSYCVKHKLKALEKYLKDFPADAIFATHPYGAAIFPEMIKALGLSIPVYYYATDVFFSPTAAITNDLRRFFISTTEGKENVIGRGEQEEKVLLCPFPLQQNIKESPVMSKEEARKKLGLDNVFTLQLNMGGEGLGSLGLLEALASKTYDLQILILGNIDKKMKKEVARVKSRASNSVKIITTGFVKNVNEYLFASDIIAGRLGINTILEAFYLKRPFLVTELVYSVKPAADYIEKYKVGWNCNRNIENQVNVIDKYGQLDPIQRKSELDLILSNFDSIPIKYDAKGLAEMLIEDIKDYKTLSNKKEEK